MSIRHLLGAVAIMAVTAGVVLGAGTAAAGTTHYPQPPNPGNGRDFHPNFCFFEPQPNVILGSSGTDSLVGTQCDDDIYGFRGNDKLTGQNGNDILFGGPGNDRLFGRDGFRDILSGGRGNDVCTGDQFDQFLSCETIIRIRVPTPWLF